MPINLYFIPRTRVSYISRHFATNCIPHKSSNFASQSGDFGSEDISILHLWRARRCPFIKKKESSPGRGLSRLTVHEITVCKITNCATVVSTGVRFLFFKSLFFNISTRERKRAREKRGSEGMEKSIETRFVINQISARIASHSATGREIRRVRIINLAGRIATGAV